MSSRNPNSILYGVDDVIERWLGIDAKDDYGAGTKKPRYGSTTAAINLSGKNLKQPFPAKELLDLISDNWTKGGKQQRSDENWRWNPKLEMEGNKGEKELEKIVAFLFGKSSWTNQIPVCSGLMPSGTEEGKRAIDLGRRISDDEFEFIELKFKPGKEGITGDSHPLYAALELLEYGLLYVFARSHKLIKKKTKNHDLSQARIVHLVVLGPEPWYQGYDFQWLSDSINGSLHELLKKDAQFCDLGLEMDFSFRQLSKNFIDSYPLLERAMESFRNDFSEYHEYQPVVK